LVTETTEIWREFGDRLKGFILKRVRNRHDAEDILQDVFIKIHNGIDKLEEKDKLQSWVYQITRNKIIDYYRRQTDVTVSSEISEDIVDESIPSQMNNKEIASCLKPMIDQIPEKYKQAVTLTEINGLTQKEMAEKLGLSLSGAKSRVQRGRDKLKELLLECCHFEFDRLGNILDYQQKTKACAHCSQDQSEK
jgi:RNA polymerase sigma-70 factor (ECF subfamily)